MMIYIQQLFIRHNLRNQSYSIKGAGINHYQQIAENFFTSRRPLYKFYIRNKVKTFIDLIITINSYIFTLSAQKTRQAQD